LFRNEKALTAITLMFFTLGAGWARSPAIEAEDEAGH